MNLIGHSLRKLFLVCILGFLNFYISAQCPPGATMHPPYCYQPSDNGTVVAFSFCPSSGSSAETYIYDGNLTVGVLQIYEGPTTAISGSPIATFPPGTDFSMTPQTVSATQADYCLNFVFLSLTGTDCSAFGDLPVVACSYDVAPMTMFTAIPDQYCIDDPDLSGLMGGTPPGGTYSGTTPGSVIDNGGSYTFSPSTAGVGMHEIIYTESGVPASDFVEVFALPTFGTPYANQCEDAGAVTLGGATPVGGIYDGPGVIDNGNGLDFAFNPGAAGQGTHTINYTYGPGCSSSTMITVDPPCNSPCGMNRYDFYCYGNGESDMVIFEICPVVSGMAVEATIVQGRFSEAGVPNDQLTVYSGMSMSGTSGTLVFGPMSGTVAGNTITSPVPDECLIFVTNTNGLYSCADGLGEGPGNATPIDPLQVCSQDVTPPAVFLDPGDFCSNDGIQMGLNGGFPTGGVYSGPGVMDNGDGMTFDFDPSMGSTGPRTLTYTVGMETPTVEIEVFAPPVVMFTAPDDVCLTDPTFINSSLGTPGGGTYSGPGVTDIGSGNFLFDPMDAEVGVHTISYMYTDPATMCSATATDDIEVFDAATFMALDDLCDNAGLQVGLTGGSPSGGTYSGTGVMDNGGSYTFDPSVGAGTYTITYMISGNACPDPTDDVEVFASTPVTLMIPAISNEFCESDPATQIGMSGMPGGGVYSGPGVNNLGDGMNFIFTPGDANIGPNTIIYTLTNSDMCVTTGTDVITVNPSPMVDFTAPADLCVDAEIQMNLSGGTPTGGSYSGPGVSNNPDGTYNFNPTDAGADVHTITYTYADPMSGCQGTASDEIEVFALPEAMFIAPDDLCEDAGIQMDLSGGSPSQGTEIGDMGVYMGMGVTDNMDGTYDFDPSIGPGMYTITYTYTDANGCSDSASDDVIVFPAATATFDIGKDFLCEDVGAGATLGGGMPTGGEYSGDGVTDDGNGTTFTYNPPGLGLQTITYTYTSPDGCEVIVEDMIEVFDCDPEITDPCSCLDNATVYDVDGMTGGEDGQFSEIVSIVDGNGGSLPAGQTWTVTAASGAYDAFIDPVPMDGSKTPLNEDVVGQTLMDDGMGGYFINFIHVDDMPYSITVEGPFAQGDPANSEFTIDNWCKYPNPEFDPSVPDDICPTSPVFTFGAIDPDMIGADDVTYELSYEGGPFMAATDFNPQTMMPGIYLVKMTYDGADDGNGGIGPNMGTEPAYPGCIQMIQKTMELREPVNFMSCNDVLQASLSADCTVELIAEMFFEDELFRCYDDYIITVNGVEDPIITEPGEYSVGLYDPVTGNNCWSTVIVEDKLGPIFPDVCSEAQPCGSFSCLDGEGFIVNFIKNRIIEGIQDCSNWTYSEPKVEYIPALTCDDTDIIIVTYTFIDEYGNSTTKDFYGEIFPVNLDDVDPAPSPVTLPCNSSTSPNVTGRPRINGTFVPFNGSNSSQLCDILVAYSDLVIPTCGENCDGSRKIIRDWTFLDWCDNDYRFETQIIHMKDTEDPVIAVFEPDTVSVDPWTCAIDRYRLPEMDAIDNCASADKLIPTVVGPAGIEVRQESDGNYYAYDVPKGTHYFEYYATDCCGNVSLVQPFELTVIDEVAPIAIAKQYTVVSLSNDGDRDGVAKLYAASLDNGSYDMCTDVHLEIRRDGVYSSRSILTDYPVDRRYPCGEVGNDSFNNDGHLYDIPSDSNSSSDLDGGEYVKFCCRDIDEEVVDANNDGEIDEKDKGYAKVWLRVWDNADMSVDTLGNPTYGTAGDHYNDTWGYVKVEVSAPPVLEVVDASIRCDWPYQDKFRERFFSDTRGEWVEQYITYSGICDVRLEVDLIDDNVDPACPRGYFELVYTATNRDSKGLQTVRVQRVYIDDLEGRMTCADIDWPASYQEVGCLDINPDPELTWHADACELVGWTMRSDTFRFESDACIKVINEYTVIDWCQFDWYYNGDDNGTGGPTGGNLTVPEPTMGYFEGGHDYLDGLLCEDPRLDLSPHDEAPDNGVYKYIEVIKVDDDVPPQMEVQDTMYAITNIECERTIQLEATVTDGSDDDCPATWFKWEITFDWNENGDFTDDYTYTRDRFGDPLRGNEENPASLEFVPYDWTKVFPYAPIVFKGPMLSYDVQYIVYDGCGNVDKEVRTVMIVDKKPPTPYCVSLSSAVMDNGQVELWARDFDKGSFDNCYDDEDLLFTFNEEHPVLDDINKVHYFKGAGEEATIDEYNEGDAQKWDPAQNSSARIFDCDDVAVSPVDVRMTVWDPKLNSDWCSVELTLINNQPDACGDTQQRASISGHIETDEGENISEVQVSIQNMKDSAYRLSMMTSNNGNYAFADNPMYTDYEIKAIKSGEDDEGVSTLDIVLIQRHILGLDEFTNPYKVIASDVNEDQRVTGSDLVVMRKLILGIYKAWPTSPVWKFVEKSDLLTVENALEDCQEKITIRDLIGNMSEQNFVGVKMGDVNGTAKANGRDAVNQTRSRGTLTLELSEQEVTEGQTVEMTFSSKDFREVYGYQFTLEMEGMVIESIEGGDAEMNASNIGVLDANTVTVSYSEIDGLGSSDELFTMRAIATQSGQLSEMIDLTSNVLNSEGYVGEGLDIHTIELTINGAEERAFSLEQNEPNPFDEVTVVGFALPVSGNATLTIYDVTGKIVTSIRGNYAQGYNEIKLNKEDLNTTGVLYYTLKSGEYSATRKMIILQ